MFLSLEVLPARKGDCLLLHFGKMAPTRLVLVDGGPSGVYGSHLKPRLEALRAARGLVPNEALQLDALLVSHIDDDHIRGILDLTKDLREAKQQQRPLPVRVSRLWHNGLEQLLGGRPAQLDSHASFGAAALLGEVELPECMDDTAAMVLASIPQGRKLEDDARFLGWQVNQGFEDGLILAKEGPVQATLADDLRLTVIGPLRSELEALWREHEAWLRKHDGEARPAAALAAYLDESVTNLSSIVLLAEMGGRRALLTGDARGDTILRGLRLAGLLPRDGGTLHLDLLKIPHHGSSRNMEEDFFRRITADHYVFSGDGEHGNPERETVEMLLDARDDGAPFTLHFTYPIAGIDSRRREDWEKARAKEEARQKKGAKKPVSSDWDTGRQSIVALFAERGIPSGGREVRVVEAGKPHFIHLLGMVSP
ncbi:hypothetical protein BKE38_11120 [Pseudoroseomonas deserti]|uniref:Metallo-beta-lactamase domain-containing protein n=1 Tax=Teichococcus deserti TaxID=1817963 RepID=A0A1V2H3J7_9PROT|nr:hypothetical protein [Pseudoroseomonas deserti]ONG54019.1 hypothetical protein BKE38_11120 [Pseudoroseomonas deserti]